MRIKPINRHLSWVRQGYSFQDIVEIRKEIKLHDFLNLSTWTIQNIIGGTVAEEPPTSKELKSLTFLFLEAADFDGDLSFLAQCGQLESLHIDGKMSFWKITDLSFLSGLSHLRHLSLPHHLVSDLSPLAALKELKLLDLTGNALTDVKALHPLKCLEKVKFPQLAEQEISDFQRDHTSCALSFLSAEDGQVYDCWWLKNRAFKSFGSKNNTSVEITIAPLVPGEWNIEERMEYDSLMTEHSQTMARKFLKSNQLLQTLSFKKNGDAIRCTYEYINLTSEVASQAV